MLRIVLPDRIALVRTPSDRMPALHKQPFFLELLELPFNHLAVLWVYGGKGSAPVYAKPRLFHPLEYVACKIIGNKYRVCHLLYYCFRNMETVFVYLIYFLLLAKYALCYGQNRRARLVYTHWKKNVVTTHAHVSCISIGSAEGKQMTYMLRPVRIRPRSSNHQRFFIARVCFINPVFFPYLAPLLLNAIVVYHKKHSILLLTL